MDSVYYKSTYLFSLNVSPGIYDLFSENNFIDNRQEIFDTILEVLSFMVSLSLKWFSFEFGRMFIIKFQ